MRAIFILLLLLCAKAVQSDGIAMKQCNSGEINVVSFVNPDPDIGSHSKLLDDVPSLAILANNPRAALPDSFTVCSDVMSVFSTKRNLLMFFNLLGSNGEQLLPAVMWDRVLFATRVAS